MDFEYKDKMFKYVHKRDEYLHGKDLVYEINNFLGKLFKLTNGLFFFFK